MIRIIALLLLLLSSIQYNKFYNILAFLLYTISLLNKDINITYNWFNVNNMSFDFNIYFGQTETLICSIVCLILSILYYSADILYNNDKYINSKLKLLTLFSLVMCFTICSNNLWQFYIGIELLGVISSVFVGIANINDNIKLICTKNTDSSIGFVSREIINNNASKNTSDNLEFVGTKITNNNIIKSATTVYRYNKFASIIFLFGTILYLLNNPKYNTLSVVCFTIACLCKSAQIPFSNWLLKATYANTLASILIHCATIIGIGIIFITKFHILFENCSYLLEIILIISFFTSIIYPIIALYEVNIKKIIACLTISSTGIMFALCALKQYSISINYFLCHAFFKSLLFLIFAYYIEYFQTKDIRKFKNLKQLNIVALIATLSAVGVPPFIGSVSKLLIGSNLCNYSILINITIELSNLLINIVVFKLYLQYFKYNENTINTKFSIKPIYILMLCSIIYGLMFITLFDYKIDNVFISIITNTLVIVISYIIACNIPNIPLQHKDIRIYKIPKYNNFYNYINKFNNKIEQLCNNIFYNYQYKLANNLYYLNNSKYKNQVKYLLIGLITVCITLLF